MPSLSVLFGVVSSRGFWTIEPNNQFWKSSLLAFARQPVAEGEFDEPHVHYHAFATEGKVLPQK